MSKADIMPDAEELKHYLYYDESSPSCLRWKFDQYIKGNSGRINVAKGSVAGAWAENVNYPGYGSWNLSLKRRKMKVHRIIYQIFHNDLSPNDDIDHIDGNPKNNKIENLRKVDHKTNMRNVRKRRDNTSGVTGVEHSCRPNRSPCAVARWVDEKGRKVTRSFAESVHGKEGSWMKAVIARKEALSLLRSEHGYTDRHGED